jgi:hypothetical protein
MGVEPEQVLEQYQIAPQGRIEEAEAKARSSAISVRAMASTGVPRMKIRLVA